MRSFMLVSASPKVDDRLRFRRIFERGRCVQSARVHPFYSKCVVQARHIRKNTPTDNKNLLVRASHAGPRFFARLKATQACNLSFYSHRRLVSRFSVRPNCRKLNSAGNPKSRTPAVALTTPNTETRRPRARAYRCTTVAPLPPNDCLILRVHKCTTHPLAGPAGQRAPEYLRLVRRAVFRWPLPPVKVGSWAPE